LRQLEAVLIETLAQFGQPAFREPGYTGVWVPSSEAGPIRSAKIAAIGVKVDAAGITSHGLAINLNTDLSYFDMIIPCGIRHCQTTSLAREQGRPIKLSAFKQVLAQTFKARFGQLSATSATVGEHKESPGRPDRLHS
jgi:lipoate-protein ligase B